MFSTRISLALAGLMSASAFTPAPLTPSPALRGPSAASSLCMSHGGGDVSRKSFLSLGFGLISAAALPPSKASADQELTPEQMAEYKALLKQAFKIEGLIDSTVEKTKSDLGSDEPEEPESGEPEKPPYDPYLDGPQTIFNFKDLKEGKGKIIKLE